MNREFEQAVADIQRLARNYTHVIFLSDAAGHNRHTCGGDRNTIVAGVVDGIERLADMYEDPEMLDHIAWALWKAMEHRKHPDW